MEDLSVLTTAACS